MNWKRWLPTALLMASVFAHAAEHSSAVKWPDGRKAAFYLSFDDGCPSQITNVFPRLEKHRVPGTFYVCPQWDIFRKHEGAWATNSEYVVLGNHTFTHGRYKTPAEFERDVAACNDAIRRVGADRRWPRTIAFGVPGAESVHQLCEITDEELAAVYARNHLVERLPWNGYPVTCRTIPEMEAYVDGVIASGGVGHLDFHGVGGDWLDPGLEYFDAVMRKLDACRGDLWLATFAEIHEYMKKREHMKRTEDEHNAD